LIHGHPELLTSRNTALLQLYQVVNEQQGLNSTVLYYCCQDYGIEFMPIYWQLKQVRDILQEKHE